MSTKKLPRRHVAEFDKNRYGRVAECIARSCNSRFDFGRLQPDAVDDHNVCGRLGCAGRWFSADAPARQRRRKSFDVPRVARYDKCTRRLTVAFGEVGLPGSRNRVRHEEAWLVRVV